MLDALTHRRSLDGQEQPCMLRIVAETMRDAGEPGDDRAAHGEIHADRQVKSQRLQTFRHAEHAKKSLVPPALVIDQHLVYKRIHRCDLCRERHREHRDVRRRIRFLERAQRRCREDHVADEGQVNY